MLHLHSINIINVTHTQYEYHIIYIILNIYMRSYCKGSHQKNTEGGKQNSADFGTTIPISLYPTTQF